MKAKELEKQNDGDFRAWLSSPAGRRLFMRIQVQAGLWSSSYVDSPTGTAYNEGRRAIALNLLTEAQRVCPELYVIAIREQVDVLIREQLPAAKEPAAVDD